MIRKRGVEETMSKRENKILQLEACLEEYGPDASYGIYLDDEDYNGEELAKELARLESISDEEYESEYITPKQAIRKGFNL